MTAIDDSRVATPVLVKDPPPSTAGPVGVAGGAGETAGLIKLPTKTTARRTRRIRVPSGLERLAGVFILLAGWQIASSAGWLAPDILAGPSTVATVGWDLLRDGTLGDALWTSLKRVLWGLGLGVPIGAGLALASGLTRVGDDLIDTNVQMLRFVPIIGLQPLLIVWLGLGETAKISLIVMGVAFPIYVQTVSAIRALDPKFVELSSVVGLTRRGLVRRVILPGVLPGFLVGLRMATAVAWLLLVFAEQINAHSGIGFLMINAQTFFQTDVIVLCLVVYAVLGLLSDAGIRLLERRLLRWAPGR